jgi:hypothetical protein
MFKFPLVLFLYAGDGQIELKEKLAEKEDQLAALKLQQVGKSNFSYIDYSKCHLCSTCCDSPRRMK